MSDITWTTERIKVSDLKPYERNPRRITKDKYEKLVQSIQRLGYMTPIIAQPDGRIIGGHARKKALQELKIKEIDVRIPSRELTEEEYKEALLRDNISNGEWDFDILSADFDSEFLDFVGLEVPDVAKLPAEVEEDEAPAVQETAKSVRGDIWLLGKHRVMCGDSTMIDDVEKLMNGQNADLVFTDPPYGVSYTGGLQNGKNGLSGNKRKMIKNDDVDLYESAVQMASIFCNGPVFMFYADTMPFGLYRGIEQVGGEVVALIIWKKKGGYGALGASYKPNHEPCVIWKKKKDNLNFIGQPTETRVWEEDKDGVNKLHPTQKPVSIPKRAIGNHKADVILDMFGGSGSSLIACEILGRKSRMMELDPIYCDVIIRRWQNLTGQQAIHESTGQPFGD